MKDLYKYLNANKLRFLNELLSFLSIPSVSAHPSFKKDVIRACSFLKEQLEAINMAKVQIIQTEGFPIIYAEKIISPTLPTVLIYGHYDVQPADPYDKWNYAPFEPVVIDDKIYARGACDDKGQLYMHLKAVEAMLQTNKLPCNVKFLIEGEEEVGSENLETCITQHSKMLQADIVLISDTAMLSNETPSITTGLRGLSYVEVEVTGPNRDLHSGVYGGAVSNPIQVLSKMIASLINSKGEITIPHFYDDVVAVSQKEREAFGQVPFNEKIYKADLDVCALAGESAYHVLERVSIRPSLDVNGIWGGYTEEGAKTVLPSKAFAKISMRLVPNQQSEKITKLFTDHFKSIAPPSVKVEVRPMHGGEASVTAINSIAYQAASKAMEDTFGVAPIPLRSGGSIPVVALFKKILHIDTVLFGFGLDTDAIHSPNEHFGLFNYYKGIETIPYFFKYYTDMYLKHQSEL